MLDISVIEFLQKKDYQVKVNDFVGQQLKNNYFYELIGYNAQSQPVLIKISLSDQQSYQLVKNECQILNKMKYFTSSIQLIECFDLEQQNIFILITENVNQTLDNYIQNVYSSEIIPDLDFVVNTFHSMVVSLFEIHSKGISHLNINPENVFFDSNNNLKFRNFINYNNLDQIQTSKIIKDNKYSCFNCPDTDLILSNKFSIYNFQSIDIFNLGLLVLQLIGIEVNEDTIQLIGRQEFQQLEKMMDQKFYNILSLVKSYMILPTCEQRVTIFQLRRGLFKHYEKLIDKNDMIEKIKKTIEIYQNHNLIIDDYYLLLHTSQMLYNFQVQIEKEVSNIFNQLFKEENENNYFLVYEMGVFYYESDDVQKCLQFFNQVLAIRQRMFQELHQLISESFNSVGNSYYYLDNFQEALSSYEKSCEIRKNLYGANHIFVSECLTNMADCYRWLNNKDQSIVCVEKALEIQNQTYHGSHFSKIFSLICKGQIARWKNENEQSLEYHLKVLKMRQDIYSPNHFAIALSHRTIGICYKYLKDYEKSFEQHKIALELKQKIYQENHQFIANSLFDIAECYNLKNDYENEFLYRLKHLKMMLKVKKEMIRVYHGNQILLNLDKITDIHKKIHFAIAILKVLQDSMNRRSQFIKQIIDLISEQHKLLNDEESSEQYENLNIKLLKYFN